MKESPTPEWRAAVVERLSQGGPLCRHAAQYVAENGVPIDFAPQSTGARWTVDGRIELRAGRYSAQSDPRQAQLLGAVVHEALHLEQGPELALTVAGEVEGWRVEFRAREELGAPIRNPHWEAIANIPEPPADHDLRYARREMLRMAGRRYLIWLLPLRPNRLTALAGRVVRFLGRRRGGGA
jgi:hypothetical protein